jgi:hypothetical protein
VQFTRNMKITLLLELPFRREALGKILGFAMWSLGAVAGAGWANSGEVRRSLAGEGRWKGLWVLGDRFRGSDGASRRGAAPAASDGGRCDRPAGEVVALGGKRVLRRALVDASEDGGKVYLDLRRPGPELRRDCHPWHRRRLGPGYSAG